MQEIEKGICRPHLAQDAMRAWQFAKIEMNKEHTIFGVIRGTPVFGKLPRLWQLGLKAYDLQVQA